MEFNRLKRVIKFYPFLLFLLLPIIVYTYGHYRNKSFNNHIKFTTGTITCVRCNCGKAAHCFTFQYKVNDTIYTSNNNYKGENYCFSDSCIQKEYEVAYDSLNPENAAFIWDSNQKKEIIARSKK